MVIKKSLKCLCRDPSFSIPILSQKLLIVNKNSKRMGDYMSIFRVEKSKNYTVMSNYHLRDKNLSLKTIGLLSLILSLPEDWDYSQAGLAAICKDGEDSIRSGLKELEKYGYLERERERDENGRMRGTIYHIYETPKRTSEPTLDSPTLENPILVNPTLENPTQEKPRQEKQAQINKEEYTKEKQKKEEKNTDIANKDLSINLSTEREMDTMDEIEQDREILKAKIKHNVAYDFFQHKSQRLESEFENGIISIQEYESETNSYNLKTLDKVINYMLDTLTSLNQKPIQIGDNLIDRKTVQEKLMYVGMLEMKKVVTELNINPTIKNPKKYAISMLYNA